MRKVFSSRNQVSVIFSSFTGTTLMTLYSYMISWFQHKDFKEPVLLGKMSHRLLPWIDNNKSNITGWGMHYLVGLLFAESYAPFWTGQNIKSNIKKGLVLGGISGIAAILLWRFTLNAHPFPPAVDFVPFAGQLFIAHVIFAVFAAVGYSLSNKIV